MANEEHLEILGQGAKVWNKWRQESPDVVPDLGGANLMRANLMRADLRWANLIGAFLFEADLSRADLRDADLRRADLSGANLIEAFLRKADLIEADLRKADLSGTDLNGAILFRAYLSGANLSGANLIEANLIEANLIGANLSRADLSGANLRGANLGGANLRGSILPDGRTWTPETDMSVFTRSYLKESVKSLEKPQAIVQFSAFYPGTVVLGKQYPLLVFSHLEEFAKKVQEIASSFSSMMGVQPTSGLAQSLKNVETGSILTFVPFISGVTFTPREQLLVWQPPYQSVSFLFQIPHNIDASRITGSVRVYQGPLIIGEILIEMELGKAIHSQEVSLDAEATLRRFDPIFASYSHLDTPVMEYFRRQRESIGQKMLVDIYDLKSGEYWSDRLMRMIDESAVFQLFWSENSSRSEYCRREWQHALMYKDQRSRFIQPVWWKAPMPHPPDELAPFHFQRIKISTLTKAQLTVAQVKRLIKKK